MEVISGAIGYEKVHYKAIPASKIDDDIKDSSKKMFERLDSERKESLEAIKNRKASIEKNLKDLGLKRIELWIDPNDEAKIREFDKRHLREKKKSGKKSEK